MRKNGTHCIKRKFRREFCDSVGIFILERESLNLLKRKLILLVFEATELFVNRQRGEHCLLGKHAIASEVQSKNAVILLNGFGFLAVSLGNFST